MKTFDFEVEIMTPGYKQLNESYSTEHNSLEEALQEAVEEYNKMGYYVYAIFDRVTNDLLWERVD